MANSGNTIDYEAVLASALSALFPDPVDAQSAIQILSTVVCPRGWNQRVSVATLKICGADLDALRKFVDARHEYRDVVSMAEYPLQGRDWTLRNSDPARHRELVNQDWENYKAWIEHMSTS